MSKEYHIQVYMIEHLEASSVSQENMIKWGKMCPPQLSRSEELHFLQNQIVVVYVQMYWVDSTFQKVPPGLEVYNHEWSWQNLIPLIDEYCGCEYWRNERANKSLFKLYPEIPLWWLTLKYQRDIALFPEFGYLFK